MSEACPYCDGPMVIRSREHIIPKILGNRGHHNLTYVCQSCNTLKGNMTPYAMRCLADDIEAQARLVRKIADRVDALIAERGLMSGETRG